MESKKFNVNSVLLIILTTVMGLCGWSLAQNVNTVKDDIRQMKQDLAPRHEMQLELQKQDLQIQGVKVNVERNAEGILELRARVTKLEIDWAGMRAAGKVN